MDNNPNNITGYIHSVETFGLVDGPGIRFVAFLQGCHLQCKYCHNRDTWQFNIGTKYTPQELVNEIIKYKPYFNSSNGGVTFSGGDPLIQSEFLIQVITMLKKEDIHVSIDTSGFFPLTENILKVIELSDLILLDIKHIDSNKCEYICGKPNKLNLEFLEYLNKINKPVWIRQVLVPTLTDDENDLLKLKEYLSKFTNIQNIEILPYGDFGKYKWEELGVKYPLEGIRTADDNDVQRARKILGLKETDQGFWKLG